MYLDIHGCVGVINESGKINFRSESCSSFRLWNKIVDHQAVNIALVTRLSVKKVISSLKSCLSQKF